MSGPTTPALLRPLLALLGAALLVALAPLLAAWLAGNVPAGVLELPPRPLETIQPPWSPGVFAALGVLVALVAVPIVVRLARARPARSRPRARSLPWWGFAGAALLAVAWLLAWTRFDWFAPLQRHTFTPLWLGYIVVVNALTEARTGRCLLGSRPRYFAALFPASALFWWVFEFLNRFVGNWHYVNVADYGALEYTVLATMSFSTVLPAVMSTAHYLSSYPRIDAAFADMARVPWPGGRFVMLFTLFAGVLGVAAAGAWPTIAFALVWVAPALVIISLGALTGAQTGFERLQAGDLRVVFVPALSALVCGLFWEMWNYWSYARWEYAIPYVERLRIFAMPLLGYAGYLPFGIACFAVSALVAPLAARAGDPPARDDALAPA